jgi:hypothetical protein
VSIVDNLNEEEKRILNSPFKRKPQPLCWTYDSASFAAAQADQVFIENSLFEPTVERVYFFKKTDHLF